MVQGCEVRLCDPCARVRPCVPCVSRLPRCLFIGTVGLSLSLSSLQFGKLGNLLERAELVFYFPPSPALRILWSVCEAVTDTCRVLAIRFCLLACPLLTLKS
jgi:hypothetical protein